MLVALMRLLDDYPMQLKVEVELEEDGRWLAEVPTLPGVMAYGTSRSEAVAYSRTLAQGVWADRLEHGEPVPWAA